jgi:hypothetical protein
MASFDQGAPLSPDGFWCHENAVFRSEMGCLLCGGRGDHGTGEEMIVLQELLELM